MSEGSIMQVDQRVNGRLCPEAEYRDSLSDEDFWAHVFGQDGPEHEPYDQEDIELMSTIGSPCPECGQVGPCAYDADGRALIHVTEGEE